MELRFPHRKKEIVEKIQENRQIRSENDGGLGNVKNGKLRGRRTAGRPRMSWEDIGRDFLLLLNTSRRRRPQEHIWRRTSEEDRARCRVSSH